MDRPSPTPTVVAVGPLTRDLTAGVDTLPAPGGSAIATEWIVAAGGKGGNPACTAARLGARVRMVGAVGDDDAGAVVLRELRAAGIDTDGVTVDATGSTGQIVHLVEDDGARRFIEAPGLNATHVPPPGVLARACAGADAVLVSTALPRDAARAAAAAGRRAGALVLVDAAGPADTTRAVVPDADVLRGDVDEVHALTGHEPTDAASAEVAGRVLLARPRPTIAVVQAGADGDVVVTADGALRLPHLDVPTQDPTGAGDALVATLAVLLARGDAPEDAARLGAAAAAHAAGHLGARPTFADEDELLTLARDHGGGPSPS